MERCLYAHLSGLLLAVLILTTAAAEDWPRFRGTAGAGVSPSKGVPSEIGPKKNVLWKIDTQAGGSSPIIVQGRLYFSSFEGDRRSLHCLNAVTGQQIWKQTITKVREENATAPNDPATCTPAADGENVVVFFPDTALLCYSTAGALRWRVEVGPFHSMHGIASSPIIADGKVLLLVDQLRDSYLAAYELQSGKLSWKVDRTNGLTGGFSTPVILRPVDRATLVLTSGPGGLYAYDLPTGKSAFSVPGIANAPITLPVLLDTRVVLCEPVGEAMPISMLLPRYDGNKDGKISFQEAGRDVAIRRLLERIERGWGNGDQVVETSEWNQAFQSFLNNGGLVAVDVAGSGDAVTGTVAWNYRKEVPYTATPVVYEDFLFMVDNGGLVTIVDPSDGKLVQKKRLKKGGKQFFASPVAADGKVFVLDVAGQLSVLQAEPPWEELSTVDLQEPCFASPAISEGRVYLRTRAHLYCFGVVN